MNRSIVAIIILFVLGWMIFYLSTLPEGSLQITGNVVSDNTQVKTFVIDSSHLRFYIGGVENPDITVKEGDKVKIEFSSSEGFHDFVIDELNARTEKISAGNFTFVEFVADKKGTFEYYCSVGQHRANGMKGKFIVE